MWCGWLKSSLVSQVTMVLLYERDFELSLHQPFPEVRLSIVQAVIFAGL